MKDFFKKIWKNERVFKNYLTSLLGLVLVAYLAWMLSEDKATVNDIIAFGGWAITLFRTKDSVIGVTHANNKGK